MKTSKNRNLARGQMSNDEILDMVAAKIKHEDLFRRRNEIAKKTLLNTRMEAAAFYSIMKNRFPEKL